MEHTILSQSPTHIGLLSWLVCSFSTPMYRTRMARSSPQAPALPDLANLLNQGCYCHTLDRAQLEHLIGMDAGLRSMALRLERTHPHLFSSTAVFLSQAMYQSMVETIGALERTMALPGWQAYAMRDAPAVAQVQHGPQGVFMGYDFHISSQGPMLIEINTNAGGALLCAALARAQTRCCKDMQFPVLDYRTLDGLDDDFVAMFHQEWRLQRGDKALKTIAIVDDDPASQYLAPEFEMLCALLSRRGYQALVVDAKDLQYSDQTLSAPALDQASGRIPVDLVYNRLTDFMLAEDRHADLARAYAAGDVVVTPHPHAHALRANKQHLVTLSHAQALEELGVGEQDRATLARAVPAAEHVTADNADALWQKRAGYFFKPLDGFGARAVYRGDKITRKVWEHVCQGNYLAQAVVPPAVRALELQGNLMALKFDVRAYTYQGHILLLSARTYQGQATNFRTQGGGFAPVVLVGT